MHWNNGQFLDPLIDDLPHIWRGFWTTSTGKHIHGQVNFALYSLVLAERKNSWRVRGND